MFRIRENCTKVKPEQKFNFLTVLGWQFRADEKGHWYVVCQCECGKVIAIKTCFLHLKTTPTISCGCKKGTNASEHACLYYIWRQMRGRCLNKSNNNYTRYAERGITICESWKNSFDEFKAWSLSNGYQRGLTIDRKDNDGPYSPENCQWLTRSENSKKRGRDHKEKKARLLESAT